MEINLFQVIVLPIVAILLIERVVATLKGRLRRRVGLLWVLIWLAAGVSIAFPGLTTRVAQMVGIRRGADLVLYVAVLVMFVGFYLMYVRVRRLDTHVTNLVRYLAIRDAEAPDGNGVAGRGAAPDARTADHLGGDASERSSQ